MKGFLLKCWVHCAMVLLKGFVLLLRKGSIVEGCCYVDEGFCV